MDFDYSKFCPDCGCQLLHTEGCLLCPHCGWSECGYYEERSDELENKTGKSFKL